MPGAIMLFAAGFGTRMAPLTKERPKPLIDVAGKPLIAHALDLARAHGVPRIVVNAHYRANMLEAFFAGTDVALSIETPEILDTGGGLKAALPRLNTNPVFTMNTDSVWSGPNPLQELEAGWSDDMGALLLCIPRERAIGHAGEGDFRIGPDGALARGAEVVYSGLQIINTNVLAQIPDRVFSLRAAWDILAAQGALFGTIYSGQWCDVGHPGGIPLAEIMLKQSNV